MGSSELYLPHQLCLWRAAFGFSAGHPPSPCRPDQGEGSGLFHHCGLGYTGRSYGFLGALQGIRADILGGLLGIAAGSFLYIYIAASDLIPETHRQSSPYNILLVISGMALLFVLELVL
jgi:hypothetical protein